jgi:subtilisin family serine protease
MAYSYFANGIRYEVSLHGVDTTPAAGAQPAPRLMGAAAALAPVARIANPASFARRIASITGAQRAATPSQLAIVRPVARGAQRSAPGATEPTVAFVTNTLIVEGARRDDLAAAQKRGARVIDEGFDGKTLLETDSIDEVFALVQLMLDREVGAVAPNFVRRVIRPSASAPANAWALAKIGVAEAWKITKGDADVRVAILDEGVDTKHRALKHAVVAERDFIGSNGNSAMPSNDDAHGTACAGIVVSSDKTYPGIAPNCSLIAARIAMDDGSGGWVFEDFKTADAIDWCWRQGAGVLSNSWGGGPPSDPISRAFGRARTQGRNGRGAVVAIAAGNDQRPIDYPGSLPGYVTVGASNPKDERKTRTSSDGENWGSNYGRTLHVLAPGVFIWTTDIAGAAGYEPGDFTKTFNGTSSATPHVAGAAALMLSVNPALSATDVRNLLRQTAKKIQGQTGFTVTHGWGRLDLGAAVKAAKASLKSMKDEAKPKSRPAARRRKKA